MKTLKLGLPPALLLSPLNLQNNTAVRNTWMVLHFKANVDELFWKD